MSKSLLLRSAAILLIGTGAAFAQATAPTTAPANAPKATTTAPAPAAQAPKATTPAPAPKAAEPAKTAPAPAPAPKAAAPAPAAAPKAAEPAKAAPAPAAAPKAAAPVAPAGKKINLNTATAAELEALNQIGPARAKDIVEARTKGGKFKNWDDFVKRNVVPANAEAAIKNDVSF